MTDFDTLIVITEKDFKRVQSQYPRLLKNMPGKKVIFVGAEGVGEAVKEAGLSDRAAFLDENSILPFDEVHSVMTEHMAPRLCGQEMPRGVTGWYYQQFLKLNYAYMCEDEYYMTWDGDTIPCAPFDMFSEETGLPCLDMKRELHEEYFITMPKLLPGVRKVMERSFISEHMLFRVDIVKEMLEAVEANDAIPGQRFWEKIIRAIEPERITKSAFSEFETYGSFVALNHPGDYRLRDWHSFRLAGDFFDINTICDRDYEWLSHDFQAISFEKWSQLRDDQRNLFDNPEYQAKLSARQMLEIAQEEYTDGYKEVWD